jgi:hypothetical protein
VRAAESGCADGLLGEPAATRHLLIEGRLLSINRRKATLNPIAEIAAIGSSDKAGKNLYGAFIEQNVDASGILIVESASDPRNPTRARRAGASEPGQRAAMAILVFGSI